MKPPFEGDTVLRDQVAKLLEELQPDLIVETGTETGSTAFWLAGHARMLVTCDVEYHTWPVWTNALHVIGHSPNVIHMLGKMLYPVSAWRVFFWLDAHVEPFSCPILEELEAISQHFHGKIAIGIHDFKVPGTTLGFDTFGRLGALDLALVTPKLNKIYPAGWRYEYNTDDAKGARRGAVLIQDKL